MAAQIDDSPLATIRRVLADNGLDSARADDFASLIYSEFVGEQVYFAAKPWHTLAERDEQIRKSAESGISERALAKEYCISKSQVHRILLAGRMPG